MRRIKERWYFGYFEESLYGLKTDTIGEMKTYKNSIDKTKVIEHIDAIRPWLICGMLCGVDRFTGEHFEAGGYDDGEFSFTIDFYRYYKRGEVGLPHEYEEYLKKIL